MTNGEKIKTMFPSMIIGFITESQIGIYFVKNQHSANVFDLDWWNAEYKEPATKNNLGVNYRSLQDIKKLVERKADDLDGVMLDASGVIIGLYFAIANDLPSVTPQEPRWIPVSERLPEDSGEYLVSVIDKEDEEYKQVGVTWFAHPKDYDIKDGEWRELMSYEKVIAWMPLPKAYREVEE